MRQHHQRRHHRLQESRPSRQVILKPTRLLWRPTVLVPLLSVCFLAVAVGLWRQLQEPHRLAKTDPALEVAVLNEILLAEAPAPEEEILEEMKLLEEVGEGEELNDQEGEDLEEELLSLDEEALG